MAYLETIEEKALRLVEQNRVLIRSMDTAVVCGDTGRHTVIASPHGISCSCKAWRPTRVCSHVLASQLAWSQWIQEAAAS